MHTCVGGLSSYPVTVAASGDDPQDEHEHLLIDRLTALGVKVERRTELVGFEDGAGRVVPT